MAATAASMTWTPSPCWTSWTTTIGLDTIEMGVTIGVAMEAGLVKFGDAEAAIGLVKEVGKGTPLGRILGKRRRGDRQGLRRRAGTGGQGPGHAGL